MPLFIPEFLPSSLAAVDPPESLLGLPDFLSSGSKSSSSPFLLSISFLSMLSLACRGHAFCNAPFIPCGCLSTMWLLVCHVADLHVYLTQTWLPHLLLLFLFLSVRPESCQFIICLLCGVFPLNSKEVVPELKTKKPKKAWLCTPTVGGWGSRDGGSTRACCLPA